MKSQKSISKRAFSPLMTKNIDLLDSKKKSNSNYQANLYQYKQFDTNTRTDKKKPMHLLKQFMKQPQLSNKYRIVTQPVDDRPFNIISASFIHHKSKGRIEHQKSNSKLKHPTIEKVDKKNPSECMHCKKHLQQLNKLKAQISTCLSTKSLWKNGQMELRALKEQFGLTALSPLKNKANGYMSGFKTTDNIILEMKKHFYDLMKDIQALSAIDYPKMLSLKIFQYESYREGETKQSKEIKSLLAQLRNQCEGKLNQWDLQNEYQQNHHTRAILRNMKSRLSFYLSQNLHLKAKNAILQRSQEISLESQEYLRGLIEDVLASYLQQN